MRFNLKYFLILGMNRNSVLSLPSIVGKDRIDGVEFDFGVDLSQELERPSQKGFGTLSETVNLDGIETRFRSVAKGAILQSLRDCNAGL